ncbi:hypothetical protein [Piscirickettsia litoralis]|uniref:Uncharacterized protein n=1 Tax=Piscirickettsia litoralis TaxID=1891921 RepID=A0ABX3A2G6_9GAMM|nr:hypothetical protein [Piscirickettsia litoralis]ODN41828.1 hypothetical protein BGC07_01095 [Piscirickettsia litoralis]
MTHKTQLRLFSLITLIIAWAPVIISSIEYLLLPTNAFTPSKEAVILLFLLVTSPIALFSTLLCIIFYLISTDRPQALLSQLFILWSPTLVTAVSWLSHKFSANPSTVLITPLILYLAVIAMLLSIAFLFIRRKNQ